MTIKNNSKELIGNTPLLKLTSLKKKVELTYMLRWKKTTLQALSKIGLPYI